MTDATPPVTVHHLLEHRDWVRGLARRLVLDENQAADLEQQTWLRALRSPPRSGHAPRAWLGTVVRNLARDAARRKERRDRREAAVAQPEALAATVDLVQQAEALGRVVQAVVALDEPYRTTVLLRFFEGLPPRDVALRMDVPVETVRTRLRRALEKLRDVLDPERTDDPDGARAALLALAGVGTATTLASAGSGAAPWMRGAAAAALVVGAGALWWTETAPQRGRTAPPAVAVVSRVAPPVAAQDEAPAALPVPERSETAVASREAEDAPDAPPPAAGARSPAVPVRLEPLPQDRPDPGVVKPVPPPPAPRDAPGTIADGAASPGSAATKEAAPQEPPYADDATRAWDTAYERQARTAARTFERLADWCHDNDLEWTAVRVRRRMLRYTPDDPELRALLGYLRDGQGWRRDPVALDRFRTDVTDAGDPTGATYGRHYAQAEARVSNAFRLLARRADRDGKEARDDGHSAAAATWAAAAARAWERVLELEPGVTKHKDEAHEALGHPQFEGRRVTPLHLRYLERRAERVRDGRRQAAAEVEVTPEGPGGPLQAAGLVTRSARTAHVLVHTSHPEDVARRLAVAGERALRDALAEYGWPDELLERLGTVTLHVVKRDAHGGNDELVRVLRAAGVPDERVERLRKGGFGGDALSPTERVITTSSGRDAEDQAMNVVHSVVAHLAGVWSGAQHGRRLRVPEEWLWQSMGYDCTERLNGTTLTVWGAFGKYGRDAAPRPGQSVWVQLARQQVEMDDDVPLSRLVNLTLSEGQFTGREIVKGYAFLEYLLEDDPARAREFVTIALAQGSPVAALRVFGPDVLGAEAVDTAPDDVPGPGDRRALPEPHRRVLDELDRRYRVWIEKAW